MKKTILVLVVAAIAVFVGYMQLPKQQAAVESTPSVNTATSTAEGVKAYYGKGRLPTMTKEEALTAFDLGIDAKSTDAQKAIYIAAIRVLATPADEIAISSCTPMPKVLLVEKGKKAVVHNTGTSSVEVKIRKDQDYSLAAAGKATFEGIYDKPLSSYTYSCDGKAAGAVYRDRTAYWCVAFRGDDDAIRSTASTCGGALLNRCRNLCRVLAAVETRFEFCPVEADVSSRIIEFCRVESVVRRSDLEDSLGVIPESLISAQFRCAFAGFGFFAGLRVHIERHLSVYPGYGVAIFRYELAHGGVELFAIRTFEI